MSATFVPPSGLAWADSPEALAALRAGCALAFRVLVERYQPLLLRAARVFTRSQTAAEEVVQETWLRAWVGLSGFEGNAGLRPWLLCILRNTARSHFRRSHRLVAFSTMGEEGEDSVERLLASHHAHGSKHWRGAEELLPEGQLLASETLRGLAQAIERLPQRQQQVLWSRDVEELSATETRDFLNISVENQRVLLHRARKRLRTILKTRN